MQSFKDILLKAGITEDKEEEKFPNLSLAFNKHLIRFLNFEMPFELKKKLPQLKKIERDLRRRIRFLSRKERSKLDEVKKKRKRAETYSTQLLVEFKEETERLNLKSFLQKSDKESFLLEKKLKVFFQKLDYSFERKNFRLKTSLLIGLGNPHLSERGFSFFHTTGVPYIPASSIKGLVRFVFVYEKVKSGIDLESALKEADEVFGSSSEGTEHVSRVIFFDAFPIEFEGIELEKSLFSIEVATNHYSSYYRKLNLLSLDKERKPETEKSKLKNSRIERDVNPLTFLALREGAIFSFFYAVKNDSKINKNEIDKALEKALCEFGIGARTSLSHGLFEKTDS